MKYHPLHLREKISLDRDLPGDAFQTKLGLARTEILEEDELGTGKPLLELLGAELSEERCTSAASATSGRTIHWPKDRIQWHG